MSIDFLWDLEREVENGKEYFACPALGRNQWKMAEAPDELDGLAKRTANQKKMAVNIVQLLTVREAITGDLFLVPTDIARELNPRGEPEIQWTVVETKEASEMMRDVRQGPAPYFAMRVVKSVSPDLVEE